MAKGRLFAIFGSVVLIFVGYWGIGKLFQGGHGGENFSTAKVTRGDIVKIVSATGTVNPVAMVLIGTQVSGTIKHIYVDFNSPVKKGEMIAEIDPSLFEAQVEQARANVLAARANLKKAEATLTDAGRTLERNKTLFGKDLIARSELEAAETNYQMALANVLAARAQLSQAEAALKSAETNLRYTRIISPVDGVVISRNVDVGQTVAASFQTPTLFTIARDLTKMQINTNVAEADIGKISVGQLVEFTVDAYPEEIFRGKVSQVRLAPINIQNVVTYDVVILVDNPDLKLKPGMTANVSIITAEKRGVLRIPNAALRVTLTRVAAEGQNKPTEGSGVWVLEKGKPKFATLKLGISDGIHTEVVSGLEEGQEVIVETRSKPTTKSGSTLLRFFR
ncbi:MAG: efflux RND transporter periplasmic adaptor subunit [Syntrophobacterales bacterium]|nr:efflux RND transporter periplasmic adaptor subunit [Syntrophobacterales bacterium]